MGNRCLSKLWKRTSTTGVEGGGLSYFTHCSLSSRLISTHPRGLIPAQQAETSSPAATRTVLPPASRIPAAVPAPPSADPCLCPGPSTVAPSWDLSLSLSHTHTAQGLKEQPISPTGKGRLQETVVPTWVGERESLLFFLPRDPAVARQLPKPSSKVLPPRSNQRRLILLVQTAAEEARRSLGPRILLRLGHRDRQLQQHLPLQAAPAPSCALTPDARTGGGGACRPYPGVVHRHS